MCLEGFEETTRAAQLGSRLQSTRKSVLLIVSADLVMLSLAECSGCQSRRLLTKLLVINFRAYPPSCHQVVNHGVC